MNAFLTVAACWLLSPALVWLWIKADEWLDGHLPDEAPETSDADREWFAVLGVTELDEVDEDADLTYQAMCFERWEAEL